MRDEAQAAPIAPGDEALRGLTSAQARKVPRDRGGGEAAILPPRSG